MHTTQEFLLWSNCTNQCDFCWQCKKHDPLTFLNEKEMLECLNEVSIKLDQINKGDDVLLVGGEILASYFNSVNISLKRLFDKCIDLIKKDQIRYLYINTNLLYKDKTNLDYILSKFTDIEDRLKFTTSFDIYGRFKTQEVKNIFLTNLEYIRDKYPKINVVVNSIVTKQLIESNFDFLKFKENMKLKYINFIPYIPVEDDRSMDTNFLSIAKFLISREKIWPGYIKFYINDFNNNQNKRLYEYKKSVGFEECTSKYVECGHNVNFKKVTRDDECYICKLKEIFGY